MFINYEPVLPLCFNNDNVTFALGQYAQKENMVHSYAFPPPQVLMNFHIVSLIEQDSLTAWDLLP